LHNKTKARAIWLGVALGLLALCKASFLFIGVCFIVLLTDGPRRFQASPEKPAWGNFLLTYALIALAMLATTAPWIARNAAEFGKLQIVSGTDGTVLGTRMLLTEHPLLGQFYLYTPSAFRDRVVGPLTGYSKDDLKPGGRLEAAKAAKGNRIAIFNKRIKDAGYQGNTSEWLKDRALTYAIENPVRYLASIPVFAYKGAWFMDDAGAPLNLVALLCFFGVFFTAVFTRNQVLLAAFGLPAGLFFFISIFTHALTRYNAPMTPFVVLSVLWLLVALARRVFYRGFSNSPPFHLSLRAHVKPSRQG
jgi:hypothetical protein